MYTYIYIYRIKTILYNTQDDGSLHITSLAISRSNVMAVGSRSGVVNTYDMSAWDHLPSNDFGEIRPSTRKSVMNLTTGISLLNFNPDGQMLLMASQAKKEAIIPVQSSVL